MSDYPTQNAFYGATGNADDYPDASLIFSDSQGLNFEEDQECLANFDLDLLASELWPDSGDSGATSNLVSSGCSISEPYLGSSSVFSQEDEYMGLGAVNPDDVIISQSQQPYLLSGNTETFGSFQQYSHPSTPVWNQTQHGFSQHDELTDSFQHMSVYQHNDYHNGYQHNGQEQSLFHYEDQQPAIFHLSALQPSLMQCQGEPPSLASAGEPSRKRKGYRHRHQRQFLEDKEAREQRSRELNNEASVIYRKKRKNEFTKAQMELKELEDRNQQLSQRYRLLQKFCNAYRTRLQALNVPVTSFS